MSKFPPISPNNSFENPNFRKDLRKFSKTSLSTKNTNDMLQDETNNNMNNSSHNTEFPLLLINNNPLNTETKFVHLNTKVIILEKENAYMKDKLLEIENKLNNRINDIGIKINSINLNNDYMGVRSQNNQAANNLNNNKANIALEKRMDYLENLMEKENDWKNEQRKKDYEIYKSLLNKITEQVSETVKLEVGERFKADMINENNLKIFISKYNSELDNIKKLISDTSEQNKLEFELYNSSSNNNKYHNGISNDKNVSYDKFNNLSSFIEKLTLQVKNNMDNQLKINENVENRLKKVEKFNLDYQINIKKFIHLKEDLFVEKLRQLKKFIDMNLQLLLNTYNKKINDFSLNVDKNFNLITNQMIDTRHKFDFIINEINKNSNYKFKKIVEDFQTIIKRIKDDEFVYKSFFQIYSKDHKELENYIGSINSNLVINLKNEKVVNLLEHQKITSLINDLFAKMANSNSKFEIYVKKTEASSQGANNEIMKKINEITESMKNEHEENEKKFNNLINKDQEIEVNQVLNEAITKTSDIYLTEKINKMTYIDHYLHNKITDNRTSIYDLQKKLLEITMAINSSGTDMKKLRDNLKEQEMINSVKTIIDNMITNIEKIQEGSDLQSQFKKVTNRCTNLQLEINQIKDHIEEENNIKKNELMANDVNIQIEKMLNYCEFKNIYNVLQEEIKELTIKLKKEIQNNKPIVVATPLGLGSYEDAINNKINLALEKVKNDNILMWTNSVELCQQFNQPNELRKIIEQCPPIIWKKSESLKKIFDLGYQDTYPTPIVPDAQTQKKLQEDERYGENKSETSSKILQKMNPEKGNEQKNDDDKNNNDDNDDDEEEEDEENNNNNNEEEED